MVVSRRIIKELVSHASFIGPIYLAWSAGALALALSLFWMAESASRGGGQMALLVVFLVASLFLSAAIGAAAGFVVFPAAQFIVILLPLEKEQWPAALALICAGFYLAMAMAYLMWVYGSPARVFSHLNGPEVLILGIAVVTGLVSGLLFGTAMMKYIEQDGRPVR